MADAPTPPPPGSMTVPPLEGWENIATVLGVLVVVAVVAVLVLAAGTAGLGRSDWQAWLDARSSRRQGPAPDPRERPGELVRPEPS